MVATKGTESGQARDRRTTFRSSSSPGQLQCSVHHLLSYLYLYCMSNCQIMKNKGPRGCTVNIFFLIMLLFSFSPYNTSMFLCGQGQRIQIWPCGRIRTKPRTGGQTSLGEIKVILSFGRPLSPPPLLLTFCHQSSWPDLSHTISQTKKGCAKEAVLYVCS